MASSTSSNANFYNYATFDKIELEVKSGPKSSLIPCSRFFISVTSVLLPVLSPIGVTAVVAPYLLLFNFGVVAVVEFTS